MAMPEKTTNPTVLAIAFSFASPSPGAARGFDINGWAWRTVEGGWDFPFEGFWVEKGLRPCTFTHTSFIH
jgi:hypothetical protein